MPRLDNHSHSLLECAGYKYDSNTDRYFNDGSPSWEITEKIASGKIQGAFPSSTLDEFRTQEAEWKVLQKAKIKALKSSKEEAAE